MLLVAEIPHQLRLTTSRGTPSDMSRADEQALFREYGPLVYRRALTLLGSREDAEEATQEVFIKAFRSLERFERRAEVSTWLYRITTNHCLNQIRNRKRRQELFEEHVLPGARQATSVVPKPQALLLVRQLLVDADEDCARAATYVFVDGLTHLEAAELLGVSRRTVGNLVERFLKYAAARLHTRDGIPIVTDLDPKGGAA